MKLFISIFLVFSHLFSTIGFNMEIHECGGEKSYSFFGISLNSLCECDHENELHDDGCCKDKKTTIKADNCDKQTIKVFVAKLLYKDFEINESMEFNNNDIIINDRSSLTFGAKYPPGHSPPLYILYNVFLI